MPLKKENLGLAVDIAEIVAAIGVIVSVIYLAIQITDSNKEAQQQTYNDTLMLMHSPIEEMIASAELSEIVRVGGPEPDQLSDAEWFRYSFWWMTQFNMYEYLYIAHLNESVEPKVWLGTDASYDNVFRIWPGTRRAWREWRHAYAEPFRSYADDKVRQAEDDLED